MGQERLSGRTAEYEKAEERMSKKPPEIRFQRLVLWQYRPAEPLAADGIGNRLWADTFLTIVQQQAVAVIVVTAGFPNKGVCPSPAICKAQGQPGKAAGSPSRKAERKVRQQPGY